MLRDQIKIDAAEGSVVVNASVADVYKHWLNFEDYPRFITVIKSVRKLDANHFVASLAFNGKRYETTLEMIMRVSERRLAWRTIADHSAPDHFAAGVVCFASVSDQSTCVTLKLTSSFGGAVSNRVDKYLQNFKRLIESRDGPPRGPGGSRA
jgi:Predicted integral membrane protein